MAKEIRAILEILAQLLSQILEVAVFKWAELFRFGKRRKDYWVIALELFRVASLNKPPKVVKGDWLPIRASNTSQRVEVLKEVEDIRVAEIVKIMILPLMLHLSRISSPHPWLHWDKRQCLRQEVKKTLDASNLHSVATFQISLWCISQINHFIRQKDLLMEHHTEEQIKEHSLKMLSQN